MKFLVLLSILFCNDLWAHTPFAPYLVASESREDDFYIQQRRRPYPFDVSPVSRSSFDLEAFTREHSSNALDARSALFKNFLNLKKDFLYHSPFRSPQTENFALIPTSSKSINQRVAKSSGVNNLLQVRRTLRSSTCTSTPCDTLRATSSLNTWMLSQEREGERSGWSHPQASQ